MTMKMTISKRFLHFLVQNMSILFFLSLLSVVLGNLSDYSSPPNYKRLPVHESCLLEASLISEDITHDSIISNHITSCIEELEVKSKNLSPSTNVLGFITPWNKKGYDFTLKYAHKYTHIAPVWFELQVISSFYVISGENHVNQTW